MTRIMAQRGTRVKAQSKTEISKIRLGLLQEKQGNPILALASPLSPKEEPHGSQSLTPHQLGHRSSPPQPSSSDSDLHLGSLLFFS